MHTALYRGSSVGGPLGYIPFGAPCLGGGWCLYVPTYTYTYILPPTYPYLQHSARAQKNQKDRVSPPPAAGCAQARFPDTAPRVALPRVAASQAALAQPRFFRSGTLVVPAYPRPDPHTHTPAWLIHTYIRAPHHPPSPDFSLPVTCNQSLASSSGFANHPPPPPLNLDAPASASATTTHYHYHYLSYDCCSPPPTPAVVITSHPHCRLSYGYCCRKPHVAPATQCHAGLPRRCSPGSASPVQVSSLRQGLSSSRAPDSSH